MVIVAVVVLVVAVVFLVGVVDVLVVVVVVVVVAVIRQLVYAMDMGMAWWQWPPLSLRTCPPLER